MKLDYSLYSTDKNTKHSYMEVYEEIFSKYDYPVDLLEIGVETGGSLKMWKDFFREGSNICGIDNWSAPCLSKSKFNEKNVEGYRVYNGDARVYQIDEKFDIIIDDGSHVLEDVILGIKNFWWNLKDEKKSIYIIEDIPGKKITESVEEIKNRTKLEVEVIDRRHVKDRYDDVMFILSK